MTNDARSERLALAALLREVGPDAPTLCEGWDTSDLAVHLVVRDRHPATAAALGGLGEKSERLAEVADSTLAELRSLPWADLVGRVAEGPAAWSPASWGPVDRLMNTAEFLIHHEDVRRAQEGWAPRTLRRGLHEHCWTLLKTVVLPIALKQGRRVVFDAPAFGEVSAGATPQGTLRVTGTPVELLLWAWGRDEHALVTLTEE